MTWIKICANTNLEDAGAAVDAGADAVGFVFAPSSRRVEPQTVRNIIAQLPAGIEKVGIFANASVERIHEVVRHTGITAVQLQGDETLEFARALHQKLATIGEPKIIRSGNVPETGSGQGAAGWDPVAAGVLELDQAEHTVRPGVIRAMLLDSGSAEQRGGTGKTFDWHHAQFFCTLMNTSAKVIVAGGLTPGNVTEAMELLRPWGVDVASGVEAHPGRKDPAKLRDFVSAVRNRRERL